MTRFESPGPPADGGYPFDSDLHQMTDDGGPPGPDPARWTDPDWRDDPAGWGTPGDAAAAVWMPLAAGMPPEGVVVDTLSSRGLRLRVKWEGRVWRLPDGAHHPCYTPAYWRRLPAAGL